MLRYFHIVFGILLFIVFLITGQYMTADFPDKDAIPQDLRLLMRSRHIYILFSALIHVVLGVYLTVQQAAWQKALQGSGSVILTLSSLLFIWAFVAETYTQQHFTDISRYDIYASLAGVIVHIFGGVSIGKHEW